MRNFISEDDIEQAILQKLEGDPFQYGILRCAPSPDKRELLPDGTGRSSKKECVLPLILREALARLNPDIPGEKLEEIAKSFEGVDFCYAIQAGREIRIMIKPDVVSDDELVVVAREIVQKIEDEMEYPGQIKVNLIRETRAVDYAK